MFMLWIKKINRENTYLLIDDIKQKYYANKFMKKM